MRQIISPLDGIRSPFGARSGFSPVRLFGLNEPGIWLDPSDVANLDWRRNLLTYTEQFDNAAWAKTSATVAADAATAPEGTSTADKLVETSASGEHNVAVANLSVSTGFAYAVSFYAKQVERRYIAFRTNIPYAAGTFQNSFFDLQLGVVVSQGTSQTASITALSDGWYRCTVLMNGNWSGSTGVFALNLSSNGTSISYAGDGTSGVLIWGAQLELGSVATDYQRISDVNTEVLERFPNTTMYQDRAGSTAVTTPGQSVGLRLDKSKGLVLGSERIVNGDFASGSTGWTLGTGWAVSGGVATHTGTGAGYISQGGLVSGRTYKITVTITASDSRALQLIGAFWNPPGSLTIGATPGTYTVLATALSDTFWLYSNNAGTSISIDNISVRELPGFHAVANSDAARGVYGIEPVGGRRNLLDRTEEFQTGSWTSDGIRPFGSGSVADATAAPNGTITADLITPSNTTTYPRVMANSAITTTSGTPYAYSIYVKANGYTKVAFRESASTGDYASFLLSGAGSVLDKSATATATITALADGWYLISSVMTSATTSVRYGFHVLSPAYTTGNPIATWVPNGTDGVYIWGAQYTQSATATAYQRVTDQYNVTEAGKQTLHYVQYDGSDDGYVTPTITPGIDKVQVFAGVRKLSDAASAMLVELSSNTSANDGTMFVTAPGASGANSYVFASKGTAAPANAGTGVFAAAPNTSVLTGIGDISGDISTLRRNSALVATNTADQGTGNYLAYPLYIGRRGGTTLPFNGRDYGIITRFGANLDASTIAATESWLNQKTGAF